MESALIPKQLLTLATDINDSFNRFCGTIPNLDLNDQNWCAFSDLIIESKKKTCKETKRISERSESLIWFKWIEYQVEIKRKQIQ